MSLLRLAPVLQAHLIPSGQPQLIGGPRCCDNRQYEKSCDDCYHGQIDFNVYYRTYFLSSSGFTWARNLDRGTPIKSTLPNPVALNLNR